jgi:hypothetical protein
MENLRFTKSETLEEGPSNLHFDKASREFCCMVKFENYSSSFTEPLAVLQATLCVGHFNAFEQVIL